MTPWLLLLQSALAADPDPDAFPVPAAGGGVQETALDEVGAETPAEIAVEEPSLPVEVVAEEAAPADEAVVEEAAPADEDGPRVVDLLGEAGKLAWTRSLDAGERAWLFSKEKAEQASILAKEKAEAAKRAADAHLDAKRSERVEPAPKPTPDEPHARTLIGPNPPLARRAAYATAHNAASLFAGEPVKMHGFEAGASLTHRLSLGFAAMGAGRTIPDGHAALLAGGVMPGVVLRADRLAHLRADLLIGRLGVLEIEDRHWVGDAPFVRPRAALELNLSRNLRLAATAGWRFVPEQPVLDGPELGVSLRVGKLG